MGATVTVCVCVVFEFESDGGDEKSRTAKETYLFKYLQMGLNVLLMGPV